MKPLITLATTLLMSLSTAAAPGQPTAAPRVEPPNWWANHTINPVRVLVRGTHLAGALRPCRQAEPLPDRDQGAESAAHRQHRRRRALDHGGDAKAVRGLGTRDSGAVDVVEPAVVMTEAAPRVEPESSLATKPTLRQRLEVFGLKAALLQENHRQGIPQSLVPQQFGGPVLGLAQQSCCLAARGRRELAARVAELKAGGAEVIGVRCDVTSDAATFARCSPRTAGRCQPTSSTTCRAPSAPATTASSARISSRGASTVRSLKARLSTE